MDSSVSRRCFSGVWRAPANITVLEALARKAIRRTASTGNVVGRQEPVHGRKQLPFIKKDRTRAKQPLDDASVPYLLTLGMTGSFIGVTAYLYRRDIEGALRACNHLKKNLLGSEDSPSELETIAAELDLEDLQELTQSFHGGAGKSKQSKSTTSPQKKDDNDLGEESGMMIFSGSANVELARELGRMKVSRFADGEVSLEVLDDVRSRDVYVFQSVPNASTGISVHSNIMELFLAISALRRASAERITAVLPYMAYSRQEDTDDRHPRPLAVADMSLILHSLGVDRVVFVDLHAPRAGAFFPEPIPVTNLLPQSLAIRYLNRKNLRNPVVVATENRAGERAKLFWSRLKKEVDGVGLATVVSNRPDRVRASEEFSSSITTPSQFQKADQDGAFPSGSCKTYFVGDVNGRDCIIVDDIIDTGVRVSNAVRACKAAGARRVFVFASHGLLSQGAVNRLDRCDAEEVILTNSIEIPPNVYSNKIKILNISKLLAEVLKRLHAEVSPDYAADSRLSSLYRDDEFDNEQLITSHQ